MLPLFAAAFLFGLAFNAAPGPVMTETLRRGLRGGFAPALAVQLGSLVGDFSWAILGLFGAGAALAMPALRIPLELAGAALLAWMAWGALRDAMAGGRFTMADDAGPRTGALASGMALSMSNPQNIGFWAALVAPMAALGVERPVSWEAAVFLGGFAVACVAWCFVAAGTVAWCRSVLTPALHRMLNLVCAGALAAFAAVALHGAWTGLAAWG
jgi:threonine/homoserine/homoserine lactone efflux protein